jgi:penicillin-binding protein 2
VAGVLALGGLLAACNGHGQAPPTSLPTPLVQVTPALDPELTAREFLGAWQRSDYQAMYATLSTLSRDAMSLDNFKTRYQEVAAAATLAGVDFETHGARVSTQTADVSYAVTLHTAVVGDLEREGSMQMRLEQGQWKVAWEETLILPELRGGNTLVMEQTIPARGNIYDRNGKALAYETDAASLGVIPGQITDEARLLEELSPLLNLHPEIIRSRYANAQPDWYVPLGNASLDEVKSRYDELTSLGGLVMRTSHSRYYYGGGSAAHVVGYVAQVPEEQLETYQARGYRGDENVGVMGVEAWGEPFLAGKHGGRLLVVAPTGRVVATLAESPLQPASAVYTTLDRDIQTKVERFGLGGFSGAIVLLNRNTGEVLAMVSSPGFDSNLFDPSNFNSQFLLPQIFEDPRIPLLNRATQGQYPLGSVFKIVTLSAALQSGYYTPDSSYRCSGYFREIPGVVLTDWTVSWGRAPHGLIDLVHGLIQSCDPFFWHIGLDLYTKDQWLVPNMARGFGLGKATGIEVLPEEEGLIPDPAWKKETLGEDWLAGDAVNMAIGQGRVLVTPLQVADFVAAVGNGGTLYRPQLIHHIQPIVGDALFTFTPETRGTLPLSAENLATVQQGMAGVVSDENGTARFRFLGLEVKVAGKTGTAEDPAGPPHAWFAGYTYDNRPDKPDVAMVVLVQNQGEGSQIAAPIFRRVLEIYFFGKPLTKYPWEAEIGLTAMPTPGEGETPSP